MGKSKHQSHPSAKLTDSCDYSRKKKNSLKSNNSAGEKQGRKKKTFKEMIDEDLADINDDDYMFLDEL